MISHPFYCKYQSFMADPKTGRWNKYFLGATGVLGVLLAVFREYMLRALTGVVTSSLVLVL